MTQLAASSTGRAAGFGPAGCPFDSGSASGLAVVGERAHRHTSSTPYHVIEGKGYSTVNGQRLDWEEIATLKRRRIENALRLYRPYASVDSPGGSTASCLPWWRSGAGPSSSESSRRPGALACRRLRGAGDNGLAPRAGLRMGD
jgi:hypothetical protein